MKLSTKGRYATRIMICLAGKEGDTPLPKQQIADAEGMSADYVEQILMRLKAAGLVISVRGVRGGFLLARPAKEITVEDIITATEGPLDLAPCIGDTCKRESLCVTREIWAEATEAMRRVFAAKTLDELAEKLNAIRMNGVVSFNI